MRVLVTGASGFVGSHLAARLVAEGHEVRAFVRSPDKLARAIAPLGSPGMDDVAGDVRDGAAVTAAVSGCEAVFHAASVYTYDIRHASEMVDVNVAGTHNVLRAGVAAGCRPVVHVSSMVTTFGRPGVVPADPPLAPLSRSRPYVGSKIVSEALARGLQTQGAPVVITHPGAVFGPHDPGPGEMVRLLQTVLAAGAPLGIPARLAIVDVRWLAGLHVRILESSEVRHVLAPGTLVTWSELYDRCATLTGRRRPPLLPLPGVVARGTGRVADLASRLLDRRMPVGYEPGWVVMTWADADAGRATAIGGPMPPLDATLRDSIAWAAEAGHLTSRQAGLLG